MKLTKATEKAFAVVAILGTQLDDCPIPSTVLVERLEISPSYTKKLLRRLALAEIITSIPGNCGGFMLNRDQSEISVLDVIEAIEGPVSTYPEYGSIENAFTEFPNEQATGSQIVKQILNSADHKWRAELSRWTLEDILSESLWQREITSHNWKYFSNQSKV